MRICLPVASMSSLLLTALLIPDVGLAETGGDLYATEIKPLLRKRCFACHGAIRQEAGLRLDTIRAMLEGGDSGPVVVPRMPLNSLIVSRIANADPEVRMPPVGEGEPLSDREISRIRTWIEHGSSTEADDDPEPDPDQHWAFQPVQRPRIPSTGTDTAQQHPIDALLGIGHRAHRLQPLPEAPRIVLLRRLYLDLIGVPPTADELVQFEQDQRPGWYERVVDRLLEDPRHGERWGRHWMDIWRYSDWWGLGAQLRNSQKHIWHWRDWIVESLNEDLPYDEMVRLMLAADELHPADIHRLRATGYLARNYFLFNRPHWMEETVEHVSKGFLGLTMNCARCHDHKYDPIDQADFYRMRAFFEPYHVRLDMLPGATDFERDGLPRVFDGLLDEPTYRYIRGDEKNPDQSVVIQPGVPRFLEPNELQIKPVQLPPEAWMPERQPWVLDAYMAEAAAGVSTARQQLHDAAQRLHEAQELRSTFVERTRAGRADPPEPIHEPLVGETFETLDESLWELIGGDWKHEAGRLSQRQDGAKPSILRLKRSVPSDFQATVRLRIEGGSQWRSVGLSFDTVLANDTLPPDQAVSEQHVYVSAVAGGSKVQAAYRQGTGWQYPDQARHLMPIKLNHDYELEVRVRGELVNVALDGQPVIAWKTPIDRRDGVMQFTTFDCLATFSQITIRELHPSASMRQPDAAADGQPMTLAAAEGAVARAQVQQELAERRLALAESRLNSVQKRASASRARWEQRPADDCDRLRVAAIQSERDVTLLQARVTLAEATFRRLTAAADKQAEVDKQLEAARAAVDQAAQTVAAPITPEDTFQTFEGARWTPTRFFNSGKDDPQVPFPEQSSGRRTALADWITDPRHPLTARVAVNHIWMRHLGEPLVPTVFDFGRRAPRPANPELLDWLASEFIESGWSMKALHRLIVTSAAYRRSSSLVDAGPNSERDPENRYWWRRIPVRLESQVIRDSILALSGTLENTIGGPPVPLGEQQNSKRRSLYFFHSNNERNTFLTMFDEALVKDCYRRQQSIVPQQALALTNSRLVLDASAELARRLSERSSSETEFVTQAFELILGIRASEVEITSSREALAAWRGLPDGSEKSARQHLVWVLFNHNDFVTLR